MRLSLRQYLQPLLLIGCLLVCTSRIILAADEPLVRIYVHPQGLEDAKGRTPSLPGSPDGPVNGLTAARDRIREHREKDNGSNQQFEVVILPGTYRLIDPVVFASADSGTQDAPIIYRAQTPGTVRFRGDQPLQRWEPLTDKSALKRIPPEAREHIKVIDLAEYGVKSLPPLPVSNENELPPALPGLYSESTSFHLARYPDTGYDRISYAPDQPDIYRPSPRPRFYTISEAPEKWSSLDDIRLYGFWNSSAQAETVRILYVDPAENMIAFNPPNSRHWLGAVRGGRWCAMNAMEDLNQPGEYCIDRMNNRIYVYPPSSLSQGDITLSALRRPLLLFDQASHISLQGISLSHARGDGVRILGGDSVQLLGCNISHVEGTGLAIEGGNRHGAISCDFLHLGCSGVKIIYPDDAPTLQSQIEIRNCRIEKIGQRGGISFPGIFFDGGAHHRFAHNRIANTPGNGIQGSGAHTRVESNEIYAVCLESRGGSGILIDSKGHLERLGHQVVGNHIRYIQQDARWGHVGDGISNINMASETLIRNNLIEHCGLGVRNEFGHNVTIEGNMILDCPISIQVLSVEASDSWTRWREEEQGWENYFLYPKMQALEKTESFSDVLDSSALLKDLWGQHHAGDRLRLKGLTIQNNLVSPGSQMDLETVSIGDTWRNEIQAPVEIENEFISSSDDGNLTARIEKDAPAVGSFSMSDAGLQTDAWRTQVPPREGVISRMTILQPAQYTKGDSQDEARLRIEWTNIGERPVQTSAILYVAPPAAATISEVTPNPIELAPGATSSKDFMLKTLLPVPNVIVGEFLEGELFSRSYQVVPVIHTMRLPTLPTVTELDPLQINLRNDGLNHEIMIGSLPVARIHLGIVGDNQLALDIQAYDEQIRQADPYWHGSTIELFFSLPGSDLVRQIAFVPPTREGQPSIYGFENGTPIDLPDIPCRVVHRVDGYDLTAVVPLATMGISPEASTLLMDIGVSGFPSFDMPHQRVLLFDSFWAFKDNERFGRYQRETMTNESMTNPTPKEN